MNKGQVAAFLKEDHERHIRAAAEILKGVIRPTPLHYSEQYSRDFGCRVYLKPEHLQVTGSFKIRGAYNKIANLSNEELAKGVIAASAGNHAQGVGYSARARKAPATIVMPSITPMLKVNATRAYGAEVVLHGDIYDESYSEAVRLAEERDLTFVHPFDDYEVLCGQGTIGLEIIEELADVDEILVPIGGGGLIGGIALIAKAQNPSIRIVGVEPAGASSMKASVEMGKVNRLSDVNTGAEGVAVRQPGDLTFAIAGKYVDEFVSVSEKDIMENVLLIMERHKFVAEMAGIVSLAALKKRAEKGKKIVCVMSGGNIDMVTVSSIINHGLISRGRIMCFSVELQDRPGQLIRVASLLAENGANVLEIVHNHFKTMDRYSNKVALEVTVETNGPDHIRSVLDILEDNDFIVKRIY